MSETVLERWHAIVKNSDNDALNALLADDVVFHSPVVHTPQEGKPITTMYLTAALFVLGRGDFRYVREVEGPRDAVLEFEAVIDGITINGVDLIRWNDDGQIVDFKVMVRPLKAVNMLHQKMGEMLQSFTKGQQSK
jgi:hypothetical protein